MTGAVCSIMRGAGAQKKVSAVCQRNDLYLQLAALGRKFGAAMRAIQAELVALEDEHRQITSEIAQVQPKRRIPEGLAFLNFAELEYDRIIVGAGQPVQIIWKF